MGADPDLAATLDGTAPAEDDPDAFPVPGWDRYEPIRLLGQGGMGRVFLARDLRLHRNVAIKFVRGDDPELARRIVGEARAQARVSDDRVCKVFEVGEVRGRVYIAMQAIDGQALSELGGALTFEQKAMVLRGAALGVNEAHRAGLIHRDLKPANIMVERGADGELRPFVMDFGIARDWTDSTTLTGTVLGTPQYMAPEQARGEVKQLDRRADVYSLGATLYALLVDRPPIGGDNPLVVLNRIALDEPVRPRAIDPDVPADLEAIVLKCLEKERAARYDSARALADDLGRFLGGEPVAARASAGLGYRLRKRLRRHWRAVAVAAVVLAIVAVALGYGWRERRQAARREVLARRFTEQVERIDALARTSALAPAHDLRNDRALIQTEMDAIAAALRAAGSIADGPGQYALGRGYLALGDDDRAEAALQTAWRRGYRDPRAAYALALAQGHLYQRGLKQAERLSGATAAARRRALQDRYRTPALALLRRSQGPGLPAAAYVSALIAFYEERFDDALRELDAIDPAAGGMASFYEVPLLRGQILRARGTRHGGEGSAARAAADVEAARHALATAAAIAESEPAVQEAVADLAYLALVMELYSGGAVDAPFARGVEAAGRALAMWPDHGGALGVRARLRRSMAEQRARRGEDVSALLTDALADAQRALALAPERDRGDGRWLLASVHRQAGEVRVDQGEDPSEPLGQALAILDAIAGADRNADVDREVGLVHALWADYQEQAGRDAALHRGLAIAAYQAALARDDQVFLAWLNLGSAYLSRASQPGAADADGDLDRALAALARGEALGRDNFTVYLYQAQVHVLVAQRGQARGLDPGPARARAVALFQRAIATSPREPQLHSELSTVYVEQARDAATAGRDPEPLLDLAEAAAAHEIAIAPELPYGHNNLGDARLQRAGYLHDRGRDPRAVVRAAVAAFTDALARSPEHPTILLNLAASHQVAVAYEVAHGLDPRAGLAAARAAIARAFAVSSDDEVGVRLRAALDALEADWRARRGRPAAP